MPEDAAAADFAASLRELKDRSALSYGVLAKRLHMSTSTLHRYCNGDAVPTDYAPVERLARLCGASPGELVALHRRWVLADAMRGRKGAAGPEAALPVSGPEAAPAASGLDAAPDSSGVEGVTPRSGAEVAPPPPSSAGAVIPSDGSDEVPSVTGPLDEEPKPTRRPRSVRLAGVAAIAAAAVLGAVVLAVNLPSGGTDDDRGGRTVAAASDKSGQPDDASPSASVTGGSPSASATGKGKDSKDEGGGGARQRASVPASPATGSTGDDAGPAVPLTVGAAPYSWESPCSQRYLIDRAPERVSPPPLEQDAAAWVSALGAVASGEQYLTLTVQGTGERTVVVNSLTVRMDGRRAPLAWNDYAMGYPGVGCGGGVPTRSFTVALDAARPAVVPEAGHKDFPFKVSQSDPEVFYVKADASAYDVSWRLELAWSSGSRHGILTVDDRGRPFRTSGNNGRPAYEFPLGGSGWVRAGESQGS
ncbi:helix-turn-helix domain-containing protein [Streptomyces sp. NPDC087903]|uniref:helix-turn-helix domain-containing protein n=1 Tax=Streptomyces sp. NPDC087903 TaxID=3365819 RepID=UPI0038184435